MPLRLPVPGRRRRVDVAPRELAEVDARGHRLIVSAIALAPSGFHQTQDWVCELPAAVDAGTLGAAAKSWSQYVRGLMSVRVKRQGETLEVLPFRNLGARRGLHELPEQIEVLTNPDPVALGSAVVRGFARSSEATP
jgi:hypothetical protein